MRKGRILFKEEITSNGVTTGICTVKIDGCLLKFVYRDNYVIPISHKIVSTLKKNAIYNDTARSIVNESPYKIKYRTLPEKAAM